MKFIKKIALPFLIVLVLIIVVGYFYFDRKFTPEANYLNIKNESGNIPVTWLGNDKNVLLLPVHVAGDTVTYYLQFDTGHSYTVLYAEAIKNIKGISVHQGLATASFTIGKTKVFSDKFKILNNGREDGKNKAIKIIGTLGADMLENRKTLINFKENHIVFNISETPERFKNNLIDFSFKKRHIIIPALLKGKTEKFLYDSGTSAYELLTYQEVWEELKLPHAKVTTENVRSWNNTLTTFSTACNQTIQFKNIRVPLSEITYVKGFSNTQYLLMKFSGMTGMLGNKIFLKNSIYIDCIDRKISIQ